MASPEIEISWQQMMFVCLENDLFTKCQKTESPYRAVTEKVNKEYWRICVESEANGVKNQQICLKTQNSAQNWISKHSKPAVNLWVVKKNVKHTQMSSVFTNLKKFYRVKFETGQGFGEIVLISKFTKTLPGVFEDSFKWIISNYKVVKIRNLNNLRGKICQNSNFGPFKLSN